MLVTKYNYDKILKEQTSINESLSVQFLKLLDSLKREGVCNNTLNMIMVGNSISSGYSKCDEIKPLFMRNKLYELTNDINYYSFARVRHNQDSEILEWYQENKKQKEVNKLLIEDILLKKHIYNARHWSHQTIENYKENCQKDELGFRDLILNSDKDIIIYNGLTGIFTDIFRNCSNLVDLKKVFTCFKKDLQSAEYLCKLMYIDNPNIQIYFSGIPDVMGLKVTNLYNWELMKLCRKSPAMTYVPSSIRSCFLRVEGQQVFDIHYNNPEYMILLNNFMNQILSNYLPNMFACELINNLRNYHLKIEKEYAHNTGKKEDVERIIIDVVEKYRPLFEDQGRSFLITIKRVLKYYNENYLPMFCCTPRKDVIKELKKSLYN